MPLFDGTKAKPAGGDAAANAEQDKALRKKQVQRPGSGQRTFDENKHKRGAAGSGQGGRFVASGSSGDETKQVQKAVGATEDGKYGPQTEQAVRDFQARHGLQVDGVVGHQTAVAIGGDFKAAQKVAPGELENGDLGGTGFKKGRKVPAKKDEDDPKWNWRTDGNGKRGVVLKTGARRIVTAQEFDKLKREGRLHPRNEKLVGDNMSTKKQNLSVARFAREVSRKRKLASLNLGFGNIVFNALLHPRDINGRWRDVPDFDKSAPTGVGDRFSKTDPKLPTDTQDLHTEKGPDGKWQYTAERTAKHRQWINSFLEGKTPVDHPMVTWTAGGTASGKSSVVDPDNPSASGPVPLDSNTVIVDPDKFKALLPEYQAMVQQGDPRAAVLAHEESSDLAKALTAEAKRRGLNILVDGTGNSEPGKFAKKIKALSDTHQTRVVYVSVPTDTALEREHSRSLRTGRKVKEDLVRNIHVNVSANYPEVQKMAEEGVIQDLQVFDNQGEVGAPPTLVAQVKDGKVDIKDQAKYDAFLAKSGESKKATGAHLKGKETPAAKVEDGKPAGEKPGMSPSPPPDEAPDLADITKDIQSGDYGDPEHAAKVMDTQEWKDITENPDALEEFWMQYREFGFDDAFNGASQVVNPDADYLHQPFYSKGPDHPQYDLEEVDLSKLTPLSGKKAPTEDAAPPEKKGASQAHAVMNELDGFFGERITGDNGNGDEYGTPEGGGDEYGSDPLTIDAGIGVDTGSFQQDIDDMLDLPNGESVEVDYGSGGPGSVDVTFPDGSKYTYEPEGESTVTQPKVKEPTPLPERDQFKAHSAAQHDAVQAQLDDGKTFTAQHPDGSVDVTDAEARVTKISPSGKVEQQGPGAPPTPKAKETTKPDGAGTQKDPNKKGEEFSLYHAEHKSLIEDDILQPILEDGEHDDPEDVKMAKDVKQAFDNNERLTDDQYNWLDNHLTGEADASREDGDEQDAELYEEARDAVFDTVRKEGLVDKSQKADSPQQQATDDVKIAKDGQDIADALTGHLEDVGYDRDQIGGDGVPETMHDDELMDETWWNALINMQTDIDKGEASPNALTATPMGVIMKDGSVVTQDYDEKDGYKASYIPAGDDLADAAIADVIDAASEATPQDDGFYPGGYEKAQKDIKLMKSLQGGEANVPDAKSQSSNTANEAKLPEGWGTSIESKGIDPTLAPAGSVVKIKGNVGVIAYPDKGLVHQGFDGQIAVIHKVRSPDGPIWTNAQQFDAKGEPHVSRAAGKAIMPTKKAAIKAVEQAKAAGLLKEAVAIKATHKKSAADALEAEKKAKSQKLSVQIHVDPSGHTPLDVARYAAAIDAARRRRR